MESAYKLQLKRFFELITDNEGNINEKLAIAYKEEFEEYFLQSSYMKKDFVRNDTGMIKIVSELMKKYSYELGYQK
jgi:hypothetical protein